MTWQFYLMVYLALGTASYLIRRKLAQRLTRYNRLVNAFFFLGVLYPLGLIVAAFTEPDLNIGWLNLGLLLAGSCVFPLVNLLAFKASKDVDAGLYTIVNNLTPIVTIIAAAILLNENLSKQQLLGAAITICAAFLVTIPRLRHRATSSSAGLAYALMSVCLLGVAIVYERWMLSRIDFGAYLVFGWGAQTLWMTALAWPERRHLGFLRSKKNFWPVVAYSLTNALKGLAFIAALKVSGSASLVSASGSFTAVLVVLAAYVILKEKEWLWFKLAAAAIGTVGLIILNLS